MQDLRFRSGYAHTGEGLGELKRLIGDIFGIDISPLDRLGHDPSVVAFGWWQAGRLVANVSLYERRLILGGAPVLALGVQSVAVRPQWRGRGLFRDLMRRALLYADMRTDLVILVTQTPGLYAPFGFRPLRETSFSGDLTAQPSRANARDLSLSTDADLGLLRDLFGRRAPVSLVASACDHPSLFLLKASLTPAIRLVHLPDLDAVVAIRTEGRTLILHDIVAEEVPGLGDILACLGSPNDRIELRLTPDRLKWRGGQQRPVDTGYMVRGCFPVEGRAFMLSEMRI